MTFLKICGCGQRYDRRAWNALEYVGAGFYPFDDAPEVHEFRQCPCGSTLSRLLARSPDPSLRDILDVLHASELRRAELARDVARLTRGRSA